MKMITNIGKREWTLKKGAEVLKPKRSQMVEDELADKYFKSYPKDFIIAETEEPKAKNDEKDTSKAEKKKQKTKAV